MPMNGAIGIRACRPVSAPVKAANPLFWPRSKVNSWTNGAPLLWGWSSGIAPGTRPGLGSLIWDASANWGSGASRSGAKPFPPRPPPGPGHGMRAAGADDIHPADRPAARRHAGERGRDRLADRGPLHQPAATRAARMDETHRGLLGLLLAASRSLS